LYTTLRHAFRVAFNGQTLSDVDLLVLGGTLVTARADGLVVPDAGIAISAGSIVDIAARHEVSARFAAKRTITVGGMLIFPGLVDTHTHLYQTLLKGLGDDLPLIDWINACTAPSIPHLTPRMCYVAAALGCIESLRSGCTTIFDYMVDHADPQVFDAIMQAYDDVGIQGILGRGLRDRQAPAVNVSASGIDAQLADCKRLVDAYGRRRIWVAPGATWVMEEDGLRAARRFADEHGVRLSLHTDEVLFDSEESLRRFGLRSVPFLEQIGFLGPDVLHAHCVQLTDDECRILARHGGCVSYNPVSNMYLGSGVPPIPRLLELGVTVSLGADGAASNNSQDMLEALKMGALLPKVAWRDPAVFTAADAVRLATSGGAAALGCADFGTLEPGKRADLFVFDPLHAKSIPVHDPVSTLVYSSGQVNVRTVIVGGRVVLDDRRIVGVDEDAVLREAQTLAEQLAEVAGTRRRLADRWTRPRASVTGALV
jgi:5-methylthioadenosine/S-adenosylhomocysteine deaminase